MATVKLFSNISKGSAYRDGMDQFNKAMSNGYYIEAMAILESMMSDRLCSVYYERNSKTGKFIATSNLNKDVCGKIITTEECPEINDLYKKINDWLKKRNEAIHGVVKIKPDEKRSLSERYDEIHYHAEYGYDIFRELDKVVKKHKRLSQTNKHNNLLTT